MTPALAARCTHDRAIKRDVRCGGSCGILTLDAQACEATFTIFKRRHHCRLGARTTLHWHSACTGTLRCWRHNSFDSSTPTDGVAASCVAPVAAAPLRCGTLRTGDAQKQVSSVALARVCSRVTGCARRASRTCCLRRLKYDDVSVMVQRHGAVFLKK